MGAHGFMDHRYGIAYALVRRSGGKAYIGITTLGNPVARYGQHVKRAEKGSRHYIHAAIRKHSDFDVVPIACVLHPASLNDLERLLIYQWDTLAPRGYNMTSGGSGMLDLPSDARRRQAQAVREAWASGKLLASTLWRRNPAAVAEWREKITAAVNRPDVAARRSARMGTRAYQRNVSRALRSPDVQARRLIALTNNGHVRPIRCVDTGGEFPTSVAAEKWLRANGKPKARQCAILLACKGVHKQAYGLRWEFAGEGAAKRPAI